MNDNFSEVDYNKVPSGLLMYIYESFFDNKEKDNKSYCKEILYAFFTANPTECRQMMIKKIKLKFSIEKQKSIFESYLNDKPYIDVYYNNIKYSFLLDEIIKIPYKNIIAQFKTTNGQVFTENLNVHFTYFEDEDRVKYVIFNDDNVDLVSDGSVKVIR